MAHFNMHSLLLAVGLAAMTACTADVHDNTVLVDANLKLSADVDVKAVQPGQGVAVKAVVTNVYLVEPNETPPKEHVADAGHFQYYIDDFSNPPILITAKVNVTVTIPANLSPGNHKLICRVHKHDGTPTTEITELVFTVTGTATGTDASGSDATVGDAGAADATGGTDAAEADAGAMDATADVSSTDAALPADVSAAD